MPRFTPDPVRWRKIGRPHLLWFASRGDEFALKLARTPEGQWHVLQVPTLAELQGYTHVFDSGREHFVTYQQVRDMDLVDVGRVLYVDDYDDQWTDVYVSRLNEPSSRATEAEPIWGPDE